MAQLTFFYHSHETCLKQVLFCLCRVKVCKENVCVEIDIWLSNNWDNLPSKQLLTVKFTKLIYMDALKMMSFKCLLAWNGLVYSSVPNCGCFHLSEFFVVHSLVSISIWIFIAFALWLLLLLLVPPLTSYPFIVWLWECKC